MKTRRIIVPAACMALALSAYAQSAVDAYNLTRTDLRGTARFMSMAGAFGALGGDLSSLNQNPAGIGVYRGSEIGVTLDINMMSSKTEAPYSNKCTENKTKVYCNNFGYIGTVKLDNPVAPTFSWGAAYSRLASFDRVYRGNFGSLNGSLTNYIANFTNAQGWTNAELTNYDKGYNPYLDSDCDWLSILAYNSYMINPVDKVDNRYEGMWQNGTEGNSEYSIREKGYIDEYDINFGGNIANILYYGIGFGIFDLNYTQFAFYDEELSNARVPNRNATGTVTGNGYFSLDNYKSISGTGFNFKVGAILKPINEFRIGIAVHTPTWYHLSTDYDARTEYSFSSFGEGSGEQYTDLGYYTWRLKSPWRLIGSVAGVFGGRTILSVDYEYNAYPDMTVGDSYGTFADVTQDIKDYYRGSSTVRVGAEYRVTPQFSIRAGYSRKSSDVTSEVKDQAIQVYTSGTQPAFAYDNVDQYITCGLGFRISGFYIDAAYVHRNRQSEFQAYTQYDSAAGWVTPSKAKLTSNDNNLVFSIGYKF